MAIPDAPKSNVPAVPNKPAEKFIMVRALRQGFCPCQASGGRHFLREPGDVFTIKESAFTSDWQMKAEDGELPPMPPPPPPTTLPSNKQPVAITVV